MTVKPLLRQFCSFFFPPPSSCSSFLFWVFLSRSRDCLCFVFKSKVMHRMFFSKSFHLNCPHVPQSAHLRVCLILFIFLTFTEVGMTNPQSHFMCSWISLTCSHTDWLWSRHKIINAGGKNCDEEFILVKARLASISIITYGEKLKKSEQNLCSVTERIAMQVAQFLKST